LIGGPILQDLMRQALSERWTTERFSNAIKAQACGKRYY